MINAILPIFGLIIIGYAIKKSPFLRDSFWEDAEKITYFLLFPALLISKISTADLSETDVQPLILSLWSALALVSCIAFLVKPLLKISDVSFTSFFQGSVRFNTYIGLAVVNGLFGESGLVTAAIIAAMLIPAANLAVVLVLEKYNNKNTGNHFFQTLKSLLTNPLILGCLIGIGINLSHLHISTTLFSTIEILGSMALPLGLLSVGAALILKGLKLTLSPILIASIIKLGIYPIIAYTVASYFNLELQTKQIVTIFAALPSASAAYILAKNMGGDFQLMARIITLQTLFSIASLLLVLSIIGI